MDDPAAQEGSFGIFRSRMPICMFMIHATSVQNDLCSERAYTRNKQPLAIRRSRLKPDNGFTLVELLVTVVVILALSAIAVPIYIGQTGKSKEANLFSDANNVARVVAEAVSKGEFNPATGLLDAADVTVTTNRVEYAGQSVTSKGTISIYPGIGAESATTANLGKINPLNGSFCIQVSSPTHSAYYFTRGTRGAGTCVAATG